MVAIRILVRANLFFSSDQKSSESELIFAVPDSDQTSVESDFVLAVAIRILARAILF